MLSIVQRVEAGPGDEPTSPDSGIWRSAAYDGVNCLYVLGGLRNIAMDYEEIRRRWSELGSENSLSALSDIAISLGWDVVPAKVTLRQLVDIEAPLIVLLEPEGVGSGTFAIVVGHDDKMIEYINGGTLVWNQISASDFKRIWTGYVLWPKGVSSRPAFAQAGVAAVLFYFVAKAALFFLHHRRRQTICGDSR